MVKTIIDIDGRTIQVLNIMKAQYSLRDISEAIETVVQLFEENVLEPELRPTYLKKVKRVKKENSIRVKSFAGRYGLD